MLLLKWNWGLTINQRVHFGCKALLLKTCRFSCPHPLDCGGCSCNLDIKLCILQQIWRPPLRSLVHLLTLGVTPAPLLAHHTGRSGLDASLVLKSFPLKSHFCLSGLRFSSSPCMALLFVWYRIHHLWYQGQLFIPSMAKLNGRQMPSKRGNHKGGCCLVGIREWMVRESKCERVRWVGDTLVVHLVGHPGFDWLGTPWLDTST